MKTLESIAIWGVFICALLLTCMCLMWALQGNDNAWVLLFTFSVCTILAGRCIHYKW